MKQTVMVDGMTCGHCERRVAEALGEIAGVTRVVADHVSGRVEIESAGPVDPASLGAAIDEAGYAVVAS
jgi:copper chaperone